MNRKVRENYKSRLRVKKLNESYSYIEGDLNDLRNIFEFLKVFRPGAKFDPLVKAHMKSPYEYFAKPVGKKLLVMNGHLQILERFGVRQTPEENQSDYTEDELDQFLEEITPSLPFKPYDFQIKAFKESILNVKQVNKMCTGSGKSLTISLLSEFFRRKNKKGLILVPNVNLLTQFKNDIYEYNLNDLYNEMNVIGGCCGTRGTRNGKNSVDFEKPLTISTWQTIMRNKNYLDKLDYVIADEVHRFTSEETSDIIKRTINCKYKFGFTGTIPESPVSKMQLIGLFGLPKTYITSRDLIDRGLATPVQINSIIFEYSPEDIKIFKSIPNNQYAKQLKFIKEHKRRNEWIVKFTCKLRKTGNTLVLFQHTDHGKCLFIDIMKNIYPEIKIQNKDIVGKKSFDFQEKYKVYFLNGEDNSETREKTRKILEEHDNAILVANYALLSTGVNIRKLHNIVLASPLKSYTTISQSIGRLMRLHKNKKIANVYDLVDNFGVKKFEGIFYRQYVHRKYTSYNTEEYPIKEIVFRL